MWQQSTTKKAQKCMEIIGITIFFFIGNKIFHPAAHNTCKAVKEHKLGIPTQERMNDSLWQL